MPPKGTRRQLTSHPGAEFTLQEGRMSVSPACWEDEAHGQACISVEYEAFLNANSWQREALGYRVDGYNGFLVLVTLLLVLILENLWSFDKQGFKSSEAADMFVIVLIVGAACGMFTVVTITMVTLKLQRLLARDISALRVQQRGSSSHANRMDRLFKDWAKNAKSRKHCPACLAYEWYHRDKVANLLWKLCSPRRLVQLAIRTYTMMMLCFVVALSAKLSDSHSINYCVISAVLVGGAVFIASLAIYLSCTHPNGDFDRYA
ncbi:unnamed protein product [Choristocarpus tenellus]